MVTDKCRGSIKEINRDYMDKIEVLNFYGELTNDQRQSFMMLMDTLGVPREKRSGEDDISVHENTL